MIFVLLLLPVIAGSQIVPDSSVTVTFTVSAKYVDPADTIFIAGSHELIGNWHPAKIPLYRDKNNNWIRTFPFSRNTLLKFKLTRGDWGKEAIYKTGEIPQDTKLLVLNDTTVIINVLSWRDIEGSFPASGQITGEVRYHREIEGFGLRSRDLIIWLPPEYSKDIASRYPVIYMHDGQNIIDPRTSAFGVDWQLDETADSLISHNFIEPVIIVGIYNTSDRSREYIDTDSGKIYMKLVVDIIKPLIDKSYRTKPGRESTATGGSSAGGLISFMLLWEYPEIFSRAACISPVFKYSSEKSSINYVDDVINDNRKRPAFLLYIENGDDELDSKLEPGIVEMIEALKQRGYRQDKDFVWFQILNSKHTEFSWSKNCRRFLKYLFATDNYEPD
jgi:predicted alpha/beta superfamily hydrolase